MYVHSYADSFGCPEFFVAITEGRNAIYKRIHRLKLKSRVLDPDPHGFA